MLSYAPDRARSRAPWIAFLLVPLLALASLLVPAAAANAAPVAATLQVSQTTALARGGATITVTGENYNTAYAARGAAAGFYAQVGWIDTTWRPSQGAVSGNRSSAYSAWVQDVNETSPYVKWTDNGDGTADFSWTTTITAAALDAKSRAGATLAVFTVGAGGVVQADNELAVPISFVPAATLNVSQTTGLDPNGATITVTGEHYNPAYAARGAAAGFYAQVGWIDSTWRPSQGAVSGNRSSAYSAWVQDVNTASPYAKWTDNGDGTVDFSWTVTITRAALDAKTRAGATLAVFTVGAGGVVQADNELAVPISFYDDTTTLAVSATSDLDPAGATITVTGTNYDPDFVARGAAAGFYAQVGWIDSTWRPSQGAVSGNRSSAYSAWVQDVNETSPYVKWTENAYGSVDFSWTVTITQAALDAKTRAGATLAVFTVGAGGVVQAGNELAVPISFTAPTVPETPGTDPATPPAAAAGSLTWGVKASFRDYVTGSIANGAITTTGVGTSGSSFVFPQTGDAAISGGLGSVSYSGSVRFTGHAGALDLRLSDPQLRIDSATSGTLLLRVNGGTRVAFANLALSGGFVSTASDGSIRYTSVPVSLTAAGSAAFSFDGSSPYPAGTALDPVSFTIGSAGAPLGGTTIVAAAATKPANTPDATPPATEGITLTGPSVEGGAVTAGADGFQPNESGILVVIYSTPTVLAENVTADAAGRVNWTGTLPRGLTGEHTLTFQGSVDRGVVLNITAAAALQCVVSEASLVWGFKESFRAYIDGSIANGEWTTDGGVSYATPVFTWTGGTGSADPEAGALDAAYSGSVRFTGHGGVLDTTIANPHVVIDGDRATLLLDVTGTTQEGTPVAANGVEFGTLDLSGIEATRDGDTLSWTDVPASLTAAGAAAFGTYPEGEALDPVTITATVASGCGAEEVETAAEPDHTATTTPVVAEQGWPLWATILIAVVVLLLIAALVIVLVRRGRRTA